MQTGLKGYLNWKKKTCRNIPFYGENAVLAKILFPKLILEMQEQYDRFKTQIHKFYKYVQIISREKNCCFFFGKSVSSIDQFFCYSQ